MSKARVLSSGLQGSDGPPALGQEPSPYERRLRRTTDARGRVIVFEKPSALQNMRLFALVDEKAARSQGYMLYARLAASVRAIGDENGGSPDMTLQDAAPTSIVQLEVMVQRLDEEGVSAWPAPMG